VLPDPQAEPTVSMALACQALGISHNYGCQLAREGRFPVPVLPLGRRLRVPTAALRRLLELDSNGDGPGRTVSVIPLTPQQQQRSQGGG
jgi:hypothetical protein